MSGDKVLNTAEIAKFLGVSTETVARWCKDGRLPAFKIGGEWRILQSDLNRIIKFKVEKNLRGEPANKPLF